MSSEDKAIITVRLIRSFEHRNVKHVVFKDVDVHLTTTQFMEFVKNSRCSLINILFSITFSENLEQNVGRYLIRP